MSVTDSPGPRQTVSKDATTPLRARGGIPVFILASPRSFTSPVCALLGQHEQAYGVPEINLLATATVGELLALAQDRRRFLLHGLLRTVAQLYAGEQTVESVAMAHRWLRRRADVDTATVYRELCTQVGPRRIIDKSPIYAKRKAYLARLRSSFPDAHYIYLVRHPLAQGQSMLKAPQGVAELAAAKSFDESGQQPVLDPQYEWYATQVRILEFLDTVPKSHQMHFRGETLLADPEVHCRKICDWLGLDWQAHSYERMTQTEHSPYASMGPFGAQWGNNPGFQRNPAFRPRAPKHQPVTAPTPWHDDRRPLNPMVIRLARALGYEGQPDATEDNDAQSETSG